MKRYITIATLALATTLSFSLYAGSNTDNAQQKVNLDSTMKTACVGHDEGDLCSFVNAAGTSINGQCKRSGPSDNSFLQCIANGN